MESCLPPPCRLPLLLNSARQPPSQRTSPEICPERNSSTLIPQDRRITPRHFYSPAPQKPNPRQNQCVSPLVQHQDQTVSDFNLDFLTIEINIKFSSDDSFNKLVASSATSGTAVTIILNQCFVSFDSFLQIPSLCSKSLLVSAQSASQ